MNKQHKDLEAVKMMLFVMTCIIIFAGIIITLGVVNYTNKTNPVHHYKITDLGTGETYYAKSYHATSTGSVNFVSNNIRYYLQEVSIEKIRNVDPK